MTPTTKTEQLLCSLTDEQMRERAHRMGALIAEMEGVALRKKSLTADLSAEQKRLEAERSKLAMVLREGQELREVTVEVVRDFAHAEQVETRLDTGAVVRRRTLTADEMQMELPMEALDRLTGEEPNKAVPDEDDEDDDEPEAPAP